MVIFLSLPEGAGHIDALIQKCGRRVGRRIGEMTYHELLQRGTAAPATYVFLDRDRMSEPQRAIAARIWVSMEAAGYSLLNHPLRQLGRYDLLRTLHDQGINCFNVYRLDEIGNGVRFPVFVRVERDHNGPRTGLICDMAGLRKEIDRLILFGFEPEDLIVTEFEDTSDAEGLFHKRAVVKYGAYSQASPLQSTHHFVGKTYNQVSRSDLDLAAAEYARLNPDRELVAPFFDLANVDYGRIDFSVHGERIQVWEINDNPEFVTYPYMNLPRYHMWAEELSRLDEGGEAGDPVAIRV